MSLRAIAAKAAGSPSRRRERRIGRCDSEGSGAARERARDEIAQKGGNSKQLPKKEGIPRKI